MLKLCTVFKVSLICTNEECTDKKYIAYTRNKGLTSRRRFCDRCVEKRKQKKRQERIDRMKSLILTLFITALFVSPVFAGPSAPHNKAGVKADAPNLIRFSDSLTFGLEGGKDIATDVFYSEGEGVEYFEADRGYFVYAKITYSGTIFDFNK